jgi:hypothetical protein
MIPYKPELPDEEKAWIDAEALKQEYRDAKYRAEEDCRDFRRKGIPIDHIVGSVYDVPFWFQDASQGFWGRRPAEKVEDRQYRIYYHGWSDVLQECVLIAMVQGDYKFAQRVTR